MTRSIPNKITVFVQKLESLPVTQLYKLDSILSDLSNHIYEIGESITELYENIKILDINSKEKSLKEITALEEQLVSLSKLLYKMEYDGHYMDRTLHTLGWVFDEINKVIAELKKH